MQAGKLRHSVLLQRLIETQNPSTGALVKVWSDVAWVWADVRYLNGLETLKADATVSVARCSVRIRWRADVVPTMRVSHDGRLFDIKAVLPDSTGRRHLDSACETGANDG